MRLTKLLAALVIGLLACNQTVAQTTGEHCVGFSSWAKDEQSDLSAANAQSLQVKIDQIIARNRAGATSALNQLFVIYPEFVVTRTDLVESGLKSVSVVRADLTLFAVNKVDLSNYGSVVVSLQGNGNTDQEAIRSMIAHIQPTSGAFVNFIKKATAQIIDYYSNNMGRTLTQAQNLIAAERYDDALTLLGSVPVCVPAFEQSADAIAGLIKMVADKNCNAAVVMAQRYVGIGDYANAQKVLLDVKAGSACDAEVQALLASIQSKKELKTGSVPMLAIVPPMVAAPAVPATAEPVVVPTAAAEPVLAPKTESGVKITNPFKTITVKVVECKGNKADNTVEVVLLMANVSDQRLEISCHFSGPTLYTENGDAVSGTVKYPTTFQLPSELSQKSTLVFNKVGTSNKTAAVSMAVHVGSENKTIDVRNLTINWQ